MATNPNFSKILSAPKISKDVPESYCNAIARFFGVHGVADPLSDDYTSKDFFSDLICDLLEVDLIERGRIVCSLSVKPSVCNIYGGLHGGAVGSVAEKVSIACARTVVGEDKELFLGELSLSYLSAAPKNAELILFGSVVRSGRNLTVTAIDFKIKGTGKVVYTARATFYHMPVSKL